METSIETHIITGIATAIDCHRGRSSTGSHIGTMVNTSH